MSRARVVYINPIALESRFRVFVNLRKALVPYGHKVFCASLGRFECRLCDPDYMDEDCVAIAPHEDDPKSVARAFAEWCTDVRIDIVIMSSSLLATSAAPHLPASVRLVFLCHGSSPAVYKIVTSVRDYLERVLAISQRQRWDLARTGLFRESDIALTPNGMDFAPFDGMAGGRSPLPELLRLVYFGRLVDHVKGVFLLPKIASQLDRQAVPYRLDIVGGGKDEGRLRRKLQSQCAAGRAVFHGTRPPAEIPSILGHQDVFLMPSYTEGCPNALIEAMGAGIVPAVSRIRGITDWIVEEGRTGIVCPMNDANAFANAVCLLHHDRQRLRAMSSAAAEEVRRRFSLQEMGRRYHDVFQEVMARAPSRSRPRPWSEFRLNGSFPRKWRRWIPDTVRQRARAWGERRAACG